MSLCLVQSRALLGLEAAAVTVEVHLANGLPSFTLVGLADVEVKEARERVRSAIQNSGLVFPHNQRITVNLAPADLPKDSGRFDLPIALGILAAAGHIDATRLAGCEFAGELSLAGELRAVRGALALALAPGAATLALNLGVYITSPDPNINGSVGTLLVTGGPLNVGGNLEIGSSFTAGQVGRGTLTISGGGALENSEPAITGEAPNAVNAIWGSIGGGFANTVIGQASAIGGGGNNTAGAGAWSTVGGGSENTASGTYAAIGGGATNTASNSSSTVSGGFENTASGVQGSVSGGGQGTASGNSSTVAGGLLNCAGGSWSFAAGRRAKVRPGASSGAAGTGCTGVALSGDFLDTAFTAICPRSRKGTIVGDR